jgi:hypothetical protein
MYEKMKAVFPRERGFITDSLNPQDFNILSEVVFHSI